MIASEPVLRHPRRGEPATPESDSRARTLTAHLEAVGAAGLELIDLRPATVRLANPIDARSEMTWRLWNKYRWRRGRLARRSDRATTSMGVMLAPADRLLRPCVRSGPIVKTLLLRRR